MDRHEDTFRDDVKVPIKFSKNRGLKTSNYNLFLCINKVDAFK